MKYLVPIHRTLRLFCFIILASYPAVAQTQAMPPELVVDLQQVNQVALSPDGKRVAYVVSLPRTPDEEVGHNYLAIYVVPSAGGAERQFTKPPIDAWSVSWSPDGKNLAFLSKNESYDKNTQVYLMPVDGGGAQRLTRHPTSVSAYHWSPDGKWVAFTACDPETEEEKLAKKKGEDWEIPDEQFKHTRLWLWEVASGKSRKLYEGNLTTWAFVWAPDSRTLAFQATETPLIDDSYMFKKIYTVGINGDTPKVLCETTGKLGPMAFAPDGSKFAFTGAVSLNDPLAQSLFVVDAGGGKPKNLIENYRGSANSIAWLDANTILLLGTEGTQTALHKVNAETGAMSSVYRGPLILSSIDVQPQTGLFAAVANSPAHPNEAFVGKLAGGTLQRLTRHNPALDRVRLARQEVVTWRAADGTRIEGILTYPLNYQEGTRYPLVLQIHGGPEGVSLNGWRTRSGYPVQNLAAQDYFVLEPNYRGSGGKGVAFSKADHDDLGGKEFDDVLAGVDALVERGLVDAGRVGTGGWSYGGYLSAWAATKHSRRFRAAVVAAGISNWISFSGTTDIPHEMALVHWNSYWYRQRDQHWERSPLYHIQNARTPTLVVHGKEDSRVHPGQGIELYTALKHNKVPTRLVLYPREPHGLTERAHQLDFIKRVLAWFDTYLKKSGTN